MAIASNGSANLLKYSYPDGNWLSLVSWSFLFNNDKYLIGDFNGDRQDELLAIATSQGQAELMEYSSGSWNSIWNNGGIGQIAQWSINSSDKYFAGDFDGDGKKELVAIAVDGQSHLMRYSGVEWHWSSSSYMQYGDKYIPGEYVGDDKDRLLAVADNGWAKLLEYTDNDWQWVWGNDGGNTIHLWHMAPTDRYMHGRLDNQNHDKLLAFSNTGWLHIIDYRLMKEAKSGPVIIPIGPEVNATSGKNLNFTIRAVNPDSALLPPALSASGLPSSASFVDSGNGTGVFNWTPTTSDSGDHIVSFYASDGEQVDSIRTNIKVSICGDANGDGKLTVLDVVYLINYLFKGGPAPVPLEAADANCDGKVTVSDVIYLINYLFKGGPPPGC